MSWDLCPARAQGVPGWLCAADDIILRDAATDRDDILARFVAGDLAGRPDALAALPERLLPHGRTARTHEHDGMHDTLALLLAHQPDHLLPEYGQDAGRRLTTVLYNRRRNRIRADNRHQRIVRGARASCSTCTARAGMGESAERIYLRI